jgi:hypothetical protein
MGDYSTDHFCEDCDAVIPADEISMEFDFKANEYRLAHEGPEVQVGGDGFGDRCCGTMDAPTIHWLDPEPAGAD